MITRRPNRQRSGRFSRLRSPTISNYSWFNGKGWLDRDMAVALMTLLERWSGGANNGFRSYLPQTWHLDEQRLFDGITTRPERLPYDQTVHLVRLAARPLCRAAGRMDAARTPRRQIPPAIAAMSRRARVRPPAAAASARLQDGALGREGDRRSGAAAERALQFDRAAMQFHDALDGGEAETGALMTPAQ